MDTSQVAQLSRELDRIFAFSMSRTTFREIQNALANVFRGDQEQIRKLLEAVMAGSASPDQYGDVAIDLQGLIHTYRTRMLLAKEVHDRGDFLKLLTTDLPNTDADPLLLTRVQRLDGEEFRWVSDIPAAVSLIAHMTARLQQLHRSHPDKKLFSDFQHEINATIAQLQELLG